MEWWIYSYDATNGLLTILANRHHFFITDADININLVLAQWKAEFGNTMLYN